MIGDKEFYKKEISALKREKNAVILAHYYQVPEIQDIADFIGDSFALSQKAFNIKQDIIIFAGVKFMAETAKIINPDKKVILPDMEAGCSLADSCTYEDLKNFKSKHTKHVIISYINCSSEVKTLSDVICTSGNAVRIVESFPKEQKIIFIPDKNLGNYINSITGRNMVLWNGTCKIHDILTAERVIKLKTEHTGAKLIAHPECNSAVLKIADFIGSTAAMLDFTRKDKTKKYIVATETGILHQMKKESPDKEFIIVPVDETCACNDCEYMKRITLEKIYNSLKEEQPEIILSADIIEKAKKPIMKMIEICK